MQPMLQSESTLAATTLAPLPRKSEPRRLGLNDESALVAGLRRGDDDCYERLVRIYGPRLLSVARRFFKNELDAQDAVQDAFVTTFRAIAKFDGRCRLETWLHRIVVNASLMRLRSARRRSETGLDELGKPLDSSPGTGDNQPQLAEARVLMGERRKLLRACIDRLPDRHRVVLVLRELEEFDTAETAARLGVSPNAVKIRLHRARLALVDIVKESFPHPEVGSPVL